MTEQLLTEYKQRIRQLVLVPYDDGRFEVFVDAQKIYSKKATGRFPEHGQIRAALDTRLSSLNLVANEEEHSACAVRR